MKKIFIYIIILITLLFSATSLSAAIMTWDGDGSSNRWSRTTNWVNNISPSNNDDLVFASVANPYRTTARNDFYNLTINSITFNSILASNFTVSGNAINLTSGIFNYNKTNTMNVSMGMTFNGTNTFLTSNGTLNISGALNGSSPIIMNGTGSLNLSGNNTISGPVAMNSGILNVNSATALGTSNLTMNGGTLNFNGTSSTNYSNNITVNSGTVFGNGILNNMFINNSGTISPGNNIGTLSVNNLTFSGSGNYNWQIYNATGTKGIGYDTINAATLNVSGANKFDINLWSMLNTTTSGNATNFNNTQNYTWTLVATTSGVIGFDPSKFVINTAPTDGTNGFTNSLSSGGYFALSVSGNNLNLNYISVPEPTTIALLIVGGIFMILRRKFFKTSL